MDVAYVLSQHGVLTFDEADRGEDIAQQRQRAGLNAMRLQTIARGGYDAGEDEDELLDD